MNNDVVWLRECLNLNLSTVSVCDLQSFCNVLLAPGRGLNSLWEEMGLFVMPTQIKKMHQQSNWGLRPLPSSLVSYSRLDSHFLPFMTGVIFALVTVAHPLNTGTSLLPLHNSIVRCIERGICVDGSCGCLVLLTTICERMGSSWPGLLSRRSVEEVLIQGFLRRSCGHFPRRFTSNDSNVDRYWFRTTRAWEHRLVFAHRVLANVLEFYLPRIAKFRSLTLAPVGSMRITERRLCALPFGGRRWLNGQMALIAELWQHRFRKRKPAQVLKHVFSRFCCAARSLGADWIASSQDQDFTDGVFYVWSTLSALRNVFASCSGVDPTYIIPDDLLLWLCLVLPSSLQQFDAALCTFVVPTAESSFKCKQDIAQLLLQHWHRASTQTGNVGLDGSDDYHHGRLSYRERFAAIVTNSQMEMLDSQLPHLTQIQAQVLVEASQSLLNGAPYASPKAKRLLLTIERFRIGQCKSVRISTLTSAADDDDDDDDDGDDDFRGLNGNCRKSNFRGEDYGADDVDIYD